MSGLVEHARRELELAGVFREDPDWAESVVKTVEGFTSYGHSGGSAAVAVHVLEKLLRFEALSPLTSDPNEWVDHGSVWQNRRDSRAMSNDGGQTWWYVEGRRPGERCEDGGEWGVLVRCQECGGDGVLHQPDEARGGPVPQPWGAP